MLVNLSPLEIDFLLRELAANQGMISPSASIPAWYRHSIQETLRDALLADRRLQWAITDEQHSELLREEEKAGLIRQHSCQEASHKSGL
jgi:hypothetical protein